LLWIPRLLTFHAWPVLYYMELTVYTFIALWKGRHYICSPNCHIVDHLSVWTPSNTDSATNISKEE
jgi:hypothetical protein